METNVGKKALLFTILIFVLLCTQFFAQSRIYDRRDSYQNSNSDDEDTGFNKLNKVLLNICSSLKSMLPIVVTLILFAAAVVYVAGQIVGAETRSRANVWATAMLTGAIIAVIIVLVMPPIASALLDTEVQC